MTGNAIGDPNTDNMHACCSCVMFEKCLMSTGYMFAGLQ